MGWVSIDRESQDPDFQLHDDGTFTLSGRTFDQRTPLQDVAVEGLTINKPGGEGQSLTLEDEHGSLAFKYESGQWFIWNEETPASAPTGADAPPLVEEPIGPQTEGRRTPIRDEAESEEVEGFWIGVIYLLPIVPSIGATAFVASKWPLSDSLPIVTGGATYALAQGVLEGGGGRDPDRRRSFYFPLLLSCMGSMLVTLYLDTSLSTSQPYLYLFASVFFPFVFSYLGIKLLINALIPERVSRKISGPFRFVVKQLVIAGVALPIGVFFSASRLPILTGIVTGGTILLLELWLWKK